MDKGIEFQTSGYFPWSHVGTNKDTEMKPKFSDPETGIIFTNITGTCRWNEDVLNTGKDSFLQDLSH